MPSRSTWLRLLMEDRVRPGGLVPGRRRTEDRRSNFEKDYDRVIYSAPFRRLQRKTQVHTFPDNDHVRNRLTHSIEASTVGRSLGLRIGCWLREECGESRLEPRRVAECVAAATAAHDIGNPPFGHAGEGFIQEFFRVQGSGIAASLGLSASQWQDFLGFDGNAQGFRILTRYPQGFGEGGLELTSAVVAATVKYPCAPTARSGADGPAYPKRGIFYNDAETYGAVAERLGLARVGEASWARHPLAFLVEAADDIAYTTADIEDGVELGLVDWEQASAWFAECISSRERRQVSASHESLSRYRSAAIGGLIGSAVQAYKEDYARILSGERQEGLLDGHANLLLLREKAREFIFGSVDKARRELEGRTALGGILERIFSVAGDAWRSGAAQLPSNLRVAGSLARSPFMAKETDSGYEFAHAALDFVSGLTDRYAIEVWHSMKAPCRTSPDQP